MPSDPSLPGSAVAMAASCSSRSSRVKAISWADGSVFPAAAARSSAPNGCRSSRPNTSVAGCPRAEPSRPSSRLAALLSVLTRPDASNRHDTRRNPLKDRLDVTPASFDLDVLALQVGGRAFESPPALADLAGHTVECLDQRSELVVTHRAAIDAIVEVPGLDFSGRGCQALHGLCDALREIQPHPRGAHENHERHHQEERQIDAGKRAAKHAKLAVVLVRVGDAASARGQLPGEEVARHDDGDRLARAGAPHHRGRANQFTAGRQQAPASAARSVRRRHGSAIRSAMARAYPCGMSGAATSRYGTTSRG